MVKKVIMDLDLSKATGPDFIPVMVLKNCQLELTYYLNFSIIALRSLVFQIIGTFH